MKGTVNILLDKKEQDSKRHKMTINVALKFLKILADRKVRSRKRVPYAREGTIKIELAVTFSNFNSKIVKT